jgi:hypothetical protein
MDKDVNEKPGNISTKNNDDDDKLLKQAIAVNVKNEIGRIKKNALGKCDPSTLEHTFPFFLTFGMICLML